MKIMVQVTEIWTDKDMLYNIQASQYDLFESYRRCLYNCLF